MCGKPNLLLSWLFLLLLIWSHKKIDYFLQLAQDYNEDLIRGFYFGLHDKDGSCFKFTIRMLFMNLQMNYGSPCLEYLFLILIWKMNRIRW